MRRAGILMHPTCLPNNGPCGDLGKASISFLDWLQQAGITLWQTLPLHPPGGGFSPYSSPSAFAGATFLISLDSLVKDDLLSTHELSKIHWSQSMDHQQIIHEKLPLIHRASQRLWKRDPTSVLEFTKNHHWALDWGLYEALRMVHSVDSWQDFPSELTQRSPKAIQQALEEHHQLIHIVIAAQFIFARQWAVLRRAAADRGIELLGDMPIYVAAESVDTWVNPQLFRWNSANQLSPLSGAPPDDFSPKGQHWGNPLYDWSEHLKDNFNWWIQRFEGELLYSDHLRIDHFRGFCQAWEIPDNADNDARKGRWTDSMGDALFQRCAQHFGTLPFLAEDLGVITPDVDALREKYGLMGMKVLQFAFGSFDHPYLPHNYRHSNWACYTGTHDNDSALGWYGRSDELSKHRYRVYTGRDGRDVSWDLIRLAWSSTAQWAIAPMQDILSLGSESRLNTPGQASGQWGWRCTDFPIQLAHRLRKLTETYGRLNQA